ncbi:TlpA family protein disulfide reductase [Catellatospora bangladeshensis]|uniref:TlpA family protein disulfide reductase n=1 Tax=Catellatospora bangladeshensis TaxID=310355 RepID=UPI001EF3A29B|nr:TlpA disulfide reductase family protein [Catellatospora bangladeshensis]
MTATVDAATPAVSGKWRSPLRRAADSPRSGHLAAALTALVAVLVAGCGGPGAPGPDEKVPQPFAACAPLTGGAATASQPSGAPSSAAVPDASPAIGASPGQAASAGARPAAKLRVVDLPELSLPCLAGGDDVRLGELRGPLVINLWGSWCEPCRAELPALQRLADSGRVPVLGVVTRDDRAKAAWLADELRIGMPAVYDRGGTLQAALGEKVLPMTLLVGPDGRAAVYRDVALTDETLSRLVDQHLGRV